MKTCTAGNNKILILFTLFFYLGAFFVLNKPVYAQIQNNQNEDQTIIFPNCSNPSGEIKVVYSEGTHGVPGDITEYVGSDSVYRLNENQLVQCLCPLDGTGIQTNWLKANEFTTNQIQSYIAQGWIFISDGALWGLDAEPYLAQNSEYSCNPVEEEKKAKDKDDDTDEDDDKDKDKDEDNGDILGLGTGGSVFGLAAVGNAKTIIAALLSAVSGLGLFFIISKNEKDIKKQS